MRYISILLLSIFAVTFTACKEQGPKPEQNKEADMPPNTFSVKGTVHEMTIMHDEPEFPEAEGKEVFTSRCVTCHTLRYITTQPNFPRKTWEAEVNKMIQKFHAPIDSMSAVKIVDYLVTVKGVKTIAAK